MSALQAILLAVIEGITEFLPISSTGHMIIGSSVMGIAHQDFTKFFTICIQFGAILSVLVLYWRKFVRSVDFYLKLFVAFLPAAIIGKLLNDHIDALLENVIVVGCSLLIGGVILVFIDKIVVQETGRVVRDKCHGEPEGRGHLPNDHGRSPSPPGRARDDISATGSDPNITISYAISFKIGLFQTIAMIPGVSRSAATIIGGLTQKLSRQQAAEFSFFLAVPTMLAATVYKLYAFYKNGHTLHTEDVQILIVGNLVAFLVAMAAIRSFIRYLSQHGFKVFGYYRIALGLLILTLDRVAPGLLHLN